MIAKISHGSSLYGVLAYNQIKVDELHADVLFGNRIIEPPGDNHYTIEHISRSFKKCYGITLFEYLNNYRLECVCRLLTASHLSLEEISVRCGFNCSNYLRKVFKRRYGLTPSEYRQRNGNGSNGSI